MKWLSNIFGKSEEPKPRLGVLDYKEMSIIAAANARYLRALISTKSMMINSYGKREAKKLQYVIDRLKLKLEEEEFYAKYYHARRIRLENQLQS